MNKDHVTSPLLNFRWLEFYNRIKDPSWPDIKTQQDFLSLSPVLIKEILFGHDLLEYNTNQDYQFVSKQNIISYNSLREIKKNNQDYSNEFPQLNFNMVHQADKIKVYYHNTLDGGGTNIGKEYVSIIPRLYKEKTFTNCLEWCAGPGFIGFELLSRGICQNLYLNDIYPPAIESIKITIKENLELCQDRVLFHHSSSVADLPKDWNFDLIVANPPFYNPKLDPMMSKHRGAKQNQRLAIDYGWKIHQTFYDNIKKYLAPDGIILMVEDFYASGPDNFKSMIEKNGLYINDCYYFDVEHPQLYFIEVKIKSQ